MIEGGWSFVWAAYAVAVAALAVLAGVVIAGLLRWSSRARELDKSKRT